MGRVADELTERLREARSGRDADDDTVSTDQEAGSGEELAQLVDRATRSGEDDEEADGRGEDTRRLVQEFEDARGGEEADEDSGREQGSAERWTQLAGDLAEAVGSRDRDGGRSDDDGRDQDGDIGRAVEGLVRAAAENADISDDDVERVEGAVREAMDRAESRRSGDEPSAGDGKELARLLASGDDGAAELADLDYEERERLLSSREFSDARSRGPPRERDGEDGEEDEEEYDDSAELTERVLEGRIEVDSSKKELAAEKKKVTAGETSKAEYEKKAAEHKKLEQQVAEDRADLSPDRAELVDEVVDGHRKLSEREQQLDSEEKKVAAGTVTKAAYKKNVKKYEAQRDEVYEATEELMDATDRDVGVVHEDLDGEGATAGCGSDGAFVECGSVSESADGERDSDREVCLSGVSSGCGASSESGGSKAEASCDDSGCRSSASSRGADGEENGVGEMRWGRPWVWAATAWPTPEGSAAVCDTGGGSCESTSYRVAHRP